MSYIDISASDFQTEDVVDLHSCSLRLCETLDIEEQAAQLRGWNQQYAQISAGGFSGRFVEINLGDAKLFVETISNSLLQNGLVNSDTIALGIPLCSGLGGNFCGRVENENTLQVFSGAPGFEYISPPGLRMAGLIIQSQVFNEKIAFQDNEKLFQTAIMPSLIAVDYGCNQILRRVLDDVSTITQLCPNVFLNKKITNALGETVMSAFIESFLSNVQLEPVKISASQNSKIISKVKEFVVDSPGTPPSISDISNLLKVSRRSLQYCFQESLGCSPGEFVKAIRLNCVRSMLKNCNSVSEAATYWGFWHFGNFSSDYKKFFKKLPSEDLTDYLGLKKSNRAV